MGQRASRNSDCHDGRKSFLPANARPFLLMDFATLLLGGTLDELEVSRLPTSWDELLDWTDDAEKISRTSGATDPLRLVRIEPLMHSRKNDGCVDSIPAMPPIEQTTFFAESVIIKFEFHDRTGASVPSLLLSVRDFAQYYALIRRLSDLLALERLQCGKPNVATSESFQQLTECVICCDELSNSILPCNHRICERCERRWVRKQLVCPFCKTRFQSAKEIRNGAWHLPEVSEEELHSDLVGLYDQIEKFWEKCACNNALEDSISSYVPFGRRIIVTSDDDDLLVFKTK